MEMENNSLEEEVNVELIDEETEKLLCKLDKKIKICNIVTVIATGFDQPDDMKSPILDSLGTNGNKPWEKKVMPLTIKK